MNTDVLDKAISELAKANYNFTAALSNFSKLENVEMGVVQWDEEEVELFERGLVRHNFDLAKIAFSLPDKTRREITNFFFIWKKTSRSAPIKKQVYDLYHGGYDLISITFTSHSSHNSLSQPQTSSRARP